jgi:arsenate reductase
MAEALLNHLGKGRFRAHSAGSHPTGQVHPVALQTIAAAGLSTAGLRSKGWEEFAGPGAPAMDFIFTVCDAAAHESCPVWPGHPLTVHWGLADPARASGAQEAIRGVFRDTFALLTKRMHLLLDLPLASLEGAELRWALQDTGRAS